jgi:hypothetical protein
VESIQFLQKLRECVKEYKKQLSDTRDDTDAAHFFDADLKIFLKKNKSELDILASMNFEKSFMTWVKSYLLK